MSQPGDLAALIQGYEAVPATAGEGGATVLRLAAPGRPTLFLKSGTGAVATDIRAEARRLAWLAGRAPVPTVLALDDRDGEVRLLTTAVPGVSAHDWLEAHPESAAALVAELARMLAALHALPVAGCPFDATPAVRVEEAARRLAEGLVDADDFDDERAGADPEDLLVQLHAGVPAAPDLVVAHGDCTLDNILVEDSRPTGFIDVGRLGIADRWQDLALIRRSLSEFEDGLSDLLLTAYGAPQDQAREGFHLLLDEFF
ncbi:APH(3') family aminoglycoside O-phosphotransferase [Caulobacter endophyticus]|uniref:APH(3') family aminoglycoside O-phosphotransferase n=1 Tax=Caulobacter endophyticus TaxID=2172652 RepID=UPI0022B8A8D0|nr:APH(3') family aminoglycoside O-phosphotransferase [Caulobacter endophyticus]